MAEFRRAAIELGRAERYVPQEGHGLRADRGDQVAAARASA